MGAGCHKSDLPGSWSTGAPVNPHSRRPWLRLRYPNEGAGLPPVPGNWILGSALDTGSRESASRHPGGGKGFGLTRNHLETFPEPTPGRRAPVETPRERVRISGSGSRNTPSEAPCAHPAPVHKADFAIFKGKEVNGPGFELAKKKTPGSIEGNALKLGVAFPDGRRIFPAPFFGLRGGMNRETA